MRAIVLMLLATTGAAGLIYGITSEPGVQAAEVTGAPVASGLVLPPMDAQHGKLLFASKGCVVCHSVNGVGGTDAERLDASTMNPVMNPFDFFAKIWRGAGRMIAMQQNEIGHQIEFTGQDLADIVAFVHDRAVQQTFTEDDVPANIRKLMENDEAPAAGSTMPRGGGMGGGAMGGGMMGGGMMGGGMMGR